MPENLVGELSGQAGNEELIEKWRRSREFFERIIKNQHITLVLMKPESDMLTSDELPIPTGDLVPETGLTCTRKQYLEHIRYLKELEKTYDNLKISFASSLDLGTLLYVKENTGVIMAKLNAPETAFVITEHSMISAFTDYVKIGL